MNLALLTIGIISLIYGWSQGMTVAMNSDVYYEISTLRTIRKYIFLSLGGIILLLRYIVGIVTIELKNLEEKTR